MSNFLAKLYTITPRNIIATQAGPSRRIGNNPAQPPFMPEPPKRPYTMYESFRQTRIIDIYISDEIIDPIEYTDLIQMIRTAGPEDIISVHLNCPGGRLDTGIQVVNALRNTQAHVITELEGVGHSMAALMFLCGSELIVHENTQLMFHTYSGGVLGKGSEIRGQTDATEEWFKLMAYDICYPFMSKREIARMLKGEDFWFQYSQIQPRIERMVEILTKEAECAQLAADEQTANEFDKIIGDALEEKAENADTEEERDRYLAALQYLRVGIPDVEEPEHVVVPPIAEQQEEEEEEEEEDDLPQLVSKD